MGKHHRFDARRVDVAQARLLALRLAQGGMEALTTADLNELHAALGDERRERGRRAVLEMEVSGEASVAARRIKHVRKNETAALGLALQGMFGVAGRNDDERHERAAESV